MPNSPTQASSSDDKASGYVKGLDGVIAAQTALSLVDGEQSRLFYRGICIEELTPNSSFEETVFLLWYGRLPTAPELAQFNELLSKHREIPKEVIAAIRTFPKTAHPMAVLRTLASMLSLFDSEADSRDVEANRRKAVKLTAQFPTLIAAFHRYRKGEEPIAPDFKLSHAENFLYMMHGKK